MLNANNQTQAQYLIHPNQRLDFHSRTTKYIYDYINKISNLKD